MFFNPTCIIKPLIKTNRKRRRRRRRRRRNIRNPTMKKSAKVESEDHAENLALIQQLKELEYFWKSIQNSKPRCPHTSSSHSSSSSNSNSNSSNSITSSDLHLFQTSPRTLMSSLQHRKPAFRRVLTVKNCSNAVEEILMDRRAAILSGRFKGRQLFGAEDTTGGAEDSGLTYSYGGAEICDDWMDGIQEREVMMNYDQHELPFDFSDSCSLSEEKVVVEEKTVVEVAADAAEKRGGGDGRRREKGGGFMVATACLALVLIVFALVFFSMGCNGKYVEGPTPILVPT